MTPLQLTATTPPGARLVAAAERLVPALAQRAAEHDRDGTYPHAGIAALRAERFFAAPIPQELGGLGVASVHDLVVASSRLAAGDASLAIGVNMHLAVLGNLVRRHAVAAAAGHERRAAATGEVLRAMARDGTVIAAAVSEPGQDLTRPATAATRIPAGWRIDGRKVFCTMAPAATVVLAAVTFAAGDGTERYGYAQIPVDAPGVTVHDDWDALGMRASGSHSVSFQGVELPPGAVSGGFPAGDAAAYMARNLTAGLFHAAASLGVAEAADARSREALRRRPDDARSRMLVAESAVDLAVARAALARGAALIDQHHATHAERDGSPDEVVALFAEAQAAKTFISEASSRVVDRALACSGGAGYMNGHPLSRAYRDVKAAMFMHPLGANRAYEFLGRLALGGEPALR